MASPSGQAGQTTGWAIPADGWYLVLVLESFAILGAEAVRDSELRFFWVPGIAFCPVYLLSGFFFCGTVPLPEQVGREGFLARLALKALRLFPRPRPWVRILGVLACLAPYWWSPGGFELPRFPAAVAAVLVVGTMIAQDAKSGLNTWDYLAPWLMAALALAGTLNAWTPAQAAAGLALAWLAHMLYLRHAVARHWAQVAIHLQAERKAPTAAVPLSAYATSLERPAPRAAPLPAVPPDEPVHVESGSFRVDASRMIEKLSERQLADAIDFIAAWIRSAVASEATRIQLRPAPFAKLRLITDGLMFSEAELADPYRPLLDPEAPGGPRAVQAAYGLLAVLRLDPGSVWVISGEPGKRVRFNLASRKEQEAAAADPGQGTVFEVDFGLPLGPLTVVRAACRAYARFGLSDTRLVVGRTVVPDRYPESDGWRRHSSDGWRLAWEPRPGEVASRVRVYHLGMLVEEFEEPLDLRVQIDGALSHDQLRLSISQSSVVRDDLFAAGMRLLTGLPG